MLAGKLTRIVGFQEDRSAEADSLGGRRIGRSQHRNNGKSHQQLTTIEHSKFPRRTPGYFPFAQRLVCQMRGGCRTYARRQRSRRLTPASHRVYPVLEVQQLAIRIIVEIRSSRALAKKTSDELKKGGAPFRVEFIAAAVYIERPVAAHELQHRPVPRVHKRAFEVRLHFLVRVAKQCLYGVGRFPDSFSGEPVADADGLLRVIEVQEPMDDVDPVHHQIGEYAAAEVPEPAPLTKLVVVKRLRRSAAEPRLPVDRPGRNVVVDTPRTGLIPVPGEMRLVDLADLAGLDDLVALLDVRHAPLLHPHLHDSAGEPLRLQDPRALRYLVRQWLLDIHILAGFERGDGQRDVLMIRRADQHGIDVFAVEDGAVVFAGKGPVTRDFPGLGQVLIPYIANGHDGRALDNLQVLHQRLSAPPGSNAPNTDGVVSGKGIPGNGSAHGRNSQELAAAGFHRDRKSTRLNSSHLGISYAV